MHQPLYIFHTLLEITEHKSRNYSSGSSGNKYDVRPKGNNYYKQQGSAEYDEKKPHGKLPTGKLKLKTKPFVQKLEFPKDYLAKINIKTERHVVITDSKISTTAKETATNIDFMNLTTETMEEITEKVDNLIKNSDDDKSRPLLIRLGSEKEK